MHGCSPRTRKVPVCGNKRGADCSQRRDGGLVLAEPKTRASRRSVALPPMLVAELRAQVTVPRSFGTRLAMRSRRSASRRSSRSLMRRSWPLFACRSSRSFRCVFGWIRYPVIAGASLTFLLSQGAAEVVQGHARAKALKTAVSQRNSEPGCMRCEACGWFVCTWRFGGRLGPAPLCRGG
jgi:hypothetical protein